MARVTAAMASLARRRPRLAPPRTVRANRSRIAARQSRPPPVGMQAYPPAGADRAARQQSSDPAGLRRGQGMPAVGRADPTAPRHPRPNAGFAHHPLDPLAADGAALGARFGAEARRPVSAPMAGGNPPDIGRQPAVGNLAQTLRSRPPCAAAGRRHAARIAPDPPRPDIPAIPDRAEPHRGGSEKIAAVFLERFSHRSGTSNRMGRTRRVRRRAVLSRFKRKPL